MLEKYNNEISNHSSSNSLQIYTVNMRSNLDQARYEIFNVKSIGYLDITQIRSR